MIRVDRDKGARPDHLPLPQSLAAVDGDEGHYGIVYMNAGKHVGGGVSLIEVSHQSCKKVIPGEGFRTQIQSVGPYPGDKQKNGHADAQRKHQLVKLPHIGAEKREVNQNGDNVEEPQIIGNNKVFTEGNILVQGRRDNMDIGYVLFQKHKSRHIKKQYKLESASGLFLTSVIST